MAGTIKAITFDLWDTLVIDDSDEIKRKERGLRSKGKERRHLVWEAFDNDSAPLGEATAALAYDMVAAASVRVWREQHVNWTVADRFAVLQMGLGRSLTAKALQQVIDAFETMELDIPPEPIPGIHEVLEALHGRFPMAVVSDAIVTPGRNLRKMLAGHGMLDFFDAFAFSDEVGHSKPHPSMFEAAAEALGVALDEIVHIGDRQHNDVAGAQAVGAKAVLLAVSRTKDIDNHTADAICERISDLPDVIESLAR